MLFTKKVCFYFMALLLSTSFSTLHAKELIGLPCISCEIGGTVSGIGGDNENYSESFPGNTKICVSGYYSVGKIPFVKFTKEGDPLKPNWGVKAESYKVSCKN